MISKLKWNIPPQVKSADLPTGRIFLLFQKLLDVVSLDPKQGQYLIPIENIMDGETIGQQIYEVVQHHYPHLINQ